MSGPVAGWYADPGGSGRQRYWDGARWTEHVAEQVVEQVAEQRAAEPPRAEPASGPPPGWYPDPAGSPTSRYWDGARWTAQRLPAADPVAPVPGAIDAPPPQGQPYADDPPKRRTGLIVGAATLAILLIVGLVAFQVLFARGAATPIAAAEEMVAAIDAGDTTAALRLLAPDEIDWLRGIAGELPDLADQDDFDLAAASLSVKFGPARELTEGVQAVPLERITLDLRGVGPVPWSLADAGGRGSDTTSARFDEDLRGEDAFVITVQRGGSWFVSPLGTGLELIARDLGVPGAGPGTERTGAADGMAAVDTVAQAFASSRPALTLLDVLDPSELQVLDHYRSLLNEVPPGEFQRARLVAVDEGATVRLQRLELVDDGSEFEFDFERLCVSEPGWQECLRDELDIGPRSGTPWNDRAARALFEPNIPPLMVATVQRDGRAFVSLAGTVDATLVRYLDRLDGHALAGLLAPVSSPHAVDLTIAPGESMMLPLVDGWNVIRFPEASDQFLIACPAQPGVDWSNWTVQGSNVVIERVGDPSWSGRPAQGVVVGVVEGEGVSELEVRVVDLDRGSC